MQHGKCKVIMANGVLLPEQVQIEAFAPRAKTARDIERELETRMPWPAWYFDDIRGSRSSLCDPIRPQHYSPTKAKGQHS